MSASVDFQEAEYATERPLLEIKDLAIGFTTSNGEVNAVRNAHLTVMPGETVAIVGESGSGKSTTALAAIGLLPGNGRVAAGQILFDGEDISNASEKRMIELRGNSIGMVPQDPMSNLNPVWKIGDQVRETLKANGLAERPRRRRQGPVPGRAARRRQPRQAVPARVLRRHAPARADRDRPRLPAAPAHRRRADLGARRDRAAPDPRSPGQDDHGAGHRGAADHARPRPRRRARRPGRGHVPRPGRRVRARRWRSCRTRSTRTPSGWSPRRRRWRPGASRRPRNSAWKPTTCSPRARPAWLSRPSPTTSCRSRTSGRSSSCVRAWASPRTSPPSTTSPSTSSGEPRRRSWGSRVPASPRWRRWS